MITKCACAIKSLRIGEISGSVDILATNINNTKSLARVSAEGNSISIRNGLCRSVSNLNYPIMIESKEVGDLYECSDRYSSPFREYKE